MVYVKMVNKNRIGTDFKLANNDNTPKPSCRHIPLQLQTMAVSPAPTLTMGKHHTLSPTQEKQDK